MLSRAEGLYIYTFIYLPGSAPVLPSRTEQRDIADCVACDPL